VLANRLHGLYLGLPAHGFETHGYVIVWCARRDLNPQPLDP
jgi:hypothetical protein